MKLRVFLIAGSIVLNGAGVALLATRPALAPPAVRDFFARHFRGAAESPAAPPKRVMAKAVAPKTVWPTLDSGGDLQTLVARLRGAGFPAEIIRAMIMAELSARYDMKMRAMFEPDPGTPFWKVGSTFMVSGDKRMEQYGQLQRERAKLQRELFNDPFFATDDVTAAQRRQFGSLPRQKIDQLQRIEDDYAEMGAAIRSATNGILLAEDREKLELLTRERRADLASMLSTEELADYEMRSSPMTNMLTRQLAGFNATEAEFRAIFQAQQAYSEKVSATAMTASGNYEDRRTAQQQLNERLKTSLGEARYADYVRETDRTYQQLARLVQRENLPPDTATRAFNVRDSVAQESGRIADDPVLTVDQKKVALQALAERTRNQLLGMLGPAAGPAYVKIVDNQWLNMVQRGNAVSFGGGMGGSMTYGFMGGGASIGMPVSVSFGLSPTYRNVALPLPAPPR